jgi:hypothetical protein
VLGLCLGGSIHESVVLVSGLLEDLNQLIQAFPAHLVTTMDHDPDSIVLQHIEGLPSAFDILRDQWRREGEPILKALPELRCAT